MDDQSVSLKRYRLKYLATLNDESLPEDTSPDKVIKYVEISDVRFNRGIVNKTEYRFEEAPSRARRIVRHGDVIVSTVRTYLKAVAAVEHPEPDLIVSTGFAVVRPKGNLFNSGFAGYLLQSNRILGEIVSRSVGVSYPGVNPEEIANLEILLPALPSQRSIVLFLDSETRLADALIRRKERQIEFLQEQRTAIITRAVTKGLDSNTKLRDSEVPWIGTIPSTWQVAPLYSRYELQLGKMLDSKQITGNYLVPYLRNVDVQWDSINTENLPEMDILPRQRSLLRLRVGDLLVCEGGEVGKAALWHGELEECYFQKALHRLRPISKEVVPRFLYYCLFSFAKSGVFSADSPTSTIEHLTGERLRRFRFPFPPVEEQSEIVQYLDEQNKASNNVIARIEASVDLLREYRSSLITAAVSGQINFSKLKNGAIGNGAVQ